MNNNENYKKREISSKERESGTEAKNQCFLPERTYVNNIECVESPDVVYMEWLISSAKEYRQMPKPQQSEYKLIRNNKITNSASVTNIMADA